jgi:hypothetical protein
MTGMLIDIVKCITKDVERNSAQGLRFGEVIPVLFIIDFDTVINFDTDSNAMLVYEHVV